MRQSKKTDLVDITVEMLVHFQKQKLENIKLKQAVEEGNEKLATMHGLYYKERYEQVKALRACNRAQRDYSAAIKYQNELQECCAAREEAISDIIFLINDFIDVHQNYVSVDVQKAFTTLINAITAKETILYGD